MKIYRNIFNLLALIIFFQSPVFANEFANENVSHKTLIIIGYADDNHVTSFKSLFQKPFYFQRAQFIENQITEVFLEKNYHEVSKNKFINSEGAQIDLYNSNVLCPGESQTDQQILRISICNQQQKQSQKIVDLLNSDELRTYDSIIYLGHARQGLGLGVGPFISEYTVPLVFYNDIDRGRIKKIMLASCNSQNLYKNLNSSEIQLIGTTEKLMWVKDLLPWVTSYLQKNY